MKLNFKTTLLASSLVLLSLSACGNSSEKNAQNTTNVTNSHNPADLRILPVPTSKTTGHTKEITLSLTKILSMKKDDIDHLKITFDENTYNPNDSFDISNLAIENTLDGSIFHVERMVKDTNKSLQLGNTKYEDTSDGNGKDKDITVKKIGILGDLSKERNIDLAISAKGLVVHTTKNTNKYAITINTMNLLAKITDKGVEKFNIDTQGVDLGSGLSDQTKGIIQGLKGGIAFYKTSDKLTDNNYNIKSDIALAYDSKTSELHNNTNILLDNSMIQSLFGSYKQTLKGNLNKSKSDAMAVQNTTKFVSTVLDFKNNGLMNFISSKNEAYAKQVSDPSSKTLLKTYYQGFLGKYHVLTDDELNTFVDVLFNVVLNNKDLHMTINAVVPDTLTGLYNKIKNQGDNDTSSQQKIINIKVSN